MSFPNTTEAVAKALHNETCAFHRDPVAYGDIATAFGYKGSSCADFSNTASAAIAADRQALAEQGYFIVPSADHIDPETDFAHGELYCEDGYCVACGNCHWKGHMPECKIADLHDRIEELEAALKPFAEASSCHQVTDEMLDCATQILDNYQLPKESKA